jgi:hypothetical protein
MAGRSTAGGLFPQKDPTGRWWVDHGLSIVLVVILLAQTLHAVWSGWYVFGHEQPFGKAVEPGSYGFWMWWGYEYNVSLVADTFGVLLIVILTKWLNERGSDEGNGD